MATLVSHYIIMNKSIAVAFVSKGIIKCFLFFVLRHLKSQYTMIPVEIKPDYLV